MQLCPEILAMANLQKITLANFRQIHHFRQNCLFQGHLCHLICLENYTLANFCHIRQIGHYRQNRYFGRRPFAISFDLLILLWRIYAIFTVFANVPFLLIHFPGKVLHSTLFRN